MVEECKDTKIHGRLGWKAMPFAREDLDSNFVSIGEGFIVGDQEGAQAPDIGRYQSYRNQCLGEYEKQGLPRETALFRSKPSRRTSIFLYSWLELCQACRDGGKIRRIDHITCKTAKCIETTSFPSFDSTAHTSIHLGTLSM